MPIKLIFQAIENFPCFKRINKQRLKIEIFVTLILLFHINVFNTTSFNI